MKALVVALRLLLLALQYRLWFGDGSVQEVWRAQEEARATRVELLRLGERNRTLAAEVRDLKSGLDAVEERARTDLGMIDADETFYQFVRERDASGAVPLAARPEGVPAGASAGDGGRVDRDED